MSTFFNIGALRRMTPFFNLEAPVSPHQPEIGSRTGFLRLKTVKEHGRIVR